MLAFGTFPRRQSVFFQPGIPHASGTMTIGDIKVADAHTALGLAGAPRRWPPVPTDSLIVSHGIRLAHWLHWTSTA